MIFGMYALFMMRSPNVEHQFNFEQFTPQNGVKFTQNTPNTIKTLKNVRFS